jgi:Synaptobrevin/VAMP-like protein
MSNEPPFTSDEEVPTKLRYYADRDDYEWGANPVSRTMRQAADLIERNRRDRSDSDALDQLAWLLSAPEWPGASGMEDVAEIVGATGRDLNQSGATWQRH